MNAARKHGSNWQSSGLDLCYLKPIPNSTHYQLEEELAQSNIPFNINLIAWHTAFD